MINSVNTFCLFFLVVETNQAGRILHRETKQREILRNKHSKDTGKTCRKS
jgi:hypothetical protein